LRKMLKFKAGKEGLPFLSRNGQHYGCPLGVVFRIQCRTCSECLHSALGVNTCQHLELNSAAIVALGKENGLREFLRPPKQVIRQNNPFGILIMPCDKSRDGKFMGIEWQD